VERFTAKMKTVVARQKLAVQIRDHALEGDSFFTGEGLVFAKRLWDAIEPIFDEMKAKWPDIPDSDHESVVTRVATWFHARENIARVLKSKAKARTKSARRSRRRPT